MAIKSSGVDASSNTISNVNKSTVLEATPAFTGSSLGSAAKIIDLVT